jgi:hypothetical protein
MPRAVPHHRSASPPLASLEGTRPVPLWFEHSVPVPERSPDVPMRLGDCIRAFLSGATRIDVHVRAGTGWQKINALCFEEGDDAEDPERIAALVKACADHHAAQTNAAGRYRAMVWRYFGGELERHKAAFMVELASPQRRTQAQARHNRRDQWRKALETKLMLEEILAQPGDLHFDPFAALRSRPESLLERLHRELAEMAELYEEGASTGTADGIALAEIRILWKLALLRGQEDAEIWTEIAPTIEAGLANLRGEAPAKRTSTSDAEPPPDAATVRADAPSSGRAGDPNAESTEGAPPSSGDAPCSGKSGSGA